MIHGGGVPIFEHEFDVDAPLEAVRAFHDSPEALRQLTPPGAAIQLIRFGPLIEGMEAEFRLWLGPVPVHWVARHEDVSDLGFTDIQVEGPLARWRHVHRFETVGPHQSRVKDRIDYEHPAGLSSAWTRVAFGAAALRVLFAHRSRATRRALEPR